MGILQDDNYVPYQSLDSFHVTEARINPFIGATTDARGDKDGAQVSFKLFDVTGEVLVRVFGICTVSLVGATATLKVGVAGNSSELIAQATGTDIDKDDIWLDGTPDDILAAVFGDVKASTLIVAGSDIIESVAVADITAGNIRYICLWRAISKDGKVVGVVDAGI